MRIESGHLLDVAAQLLHLLSSLSTATSIVVLRYFQASSANCLTDSALDSVVSPVINVLC